MPQRSKPDSWGESPTERPLTAVGSLAWNTVLVMAGYVLGDRWDVVEGYVGIFSKTVLVLALIAIAVYLGLRLRSRDSRHRRAR
ncbi:DedA family protein [Kitasatospora griseola]|uniref:DedA family protein n=1 Tax=Kitasatospora griseola TaxID=2064 RepID=UPI003815813A